MFSAERTFSDHCFNERRECSTWATEVEHCFQKLLSSQNKTKKILTRRGPGLAAGRENCSSHSPPIMTHMFSSFTAVLPPNPKGQQTIQEAGSWSCWDGDAPLLTGVCPLRSPSFKSMLQGSILSLFWLSTSLYCSGEKVLKIQEWFIWIAHGKNIKLQVP